MVSADLQACMHEKKAILVIAGNKYATKRLRIYS